MVELIKHFLDGDYWKMRMAPAVQAGLAEKPLGNIPEMTWGMSTKIDNWLGEATWAGGEGPGCEDGQD